MLALGSFMEDGPQKGHAALLRVRIHHPLGFVRSVRIGPGHGGMRTRTTHRDACNRLRTSTRSRERMLLGGIEVGVRIVRCLAPTGATTKTVQTKDQQQEEGDECAA